MFQCFFWKAQSLWAIAFHVLSVVNVWIPRKRHFIFIFATSCYDSLLLRHVTCGHSFHKSVESYHIFATSLSDQILSFPVDVVTQTQLSSLNICFSDLWLTSPPVFQRSAVFHSHIRTILTPTMLFFLQSFVSSQRIIDDVTVFAIDFHPYRSRSPFFRCRTTLDQDIIHVHALFDLRKLLWVIYSLLPPLVTKIVN